jgi:DNA-damage-inducible protein J
MGASVAVNLFVKTVIRERRIPFEVAASDDPFYSAANQAV